MPKDPEANPPGHIFLISKTNAVWFRSSSLLPTCVLVFSRPIIAPSERFLAMDFNLNLIENNQMFIPIIMRLHQLGTISHWHIFVINNVVSFLASSQKCLIKSKVSSYHTSHPFALLILDFHKFLSSSIVFINSSSASLKF